MNHVDEDADGDDGFDGAQVGNYATLVAGAVRRRKGLVAAVFASIVGLTVAGLAAFPKSYHVEAKLLAQRSQVLVVRGDGPDAVAPTRGAVETVLRRDSLVALIHATDLVAHWHEHRAPAQRWADALLSAVRPPESDDDRIDAMVERLEKRLVVWTTDGTITITIDWPDARMACRIVDAAQENFLEQRYAQEITALSESIAIVRSHATGLTTNIDEAVAAVERLRAARAAPRESTPAAGVDRAPVARAAPRPMARAAPEVRPESALLKLTINAKQSVIDDLESARRHRLSEMQARLVEQRATYTEHHPVVVDLEQAILALSAPSIQVKALTVEVAKLRSEYAQESRETAGDPYGPSAGLPGPTVAASNASQAPPQLPSEILRLDQELRDDRDPGTVYARGQLRDAMDKYAALRAQVQAAQIDLETAQAAFKYRYSVLKPAQLPRTATKPNVPLVALASIVGGLLAAVLLAVFAEVRKGRLVERWQIEQLLERPILGEMSLPRLPSHDSE
jgi:hypothetical protein